LRQIVDLAIQNEKLKPNTTLWLPSFLEGWCGQHSPYAAMRQAVGRNELERSASIMTNKNGTQNRKIGKSGLMSKQFKTKARIFGLANKT
uniref:hypothetical protein n=1 Tax=Carboxylicivirga TaxID=1628153 RepID=UPI003D3250A6